MSAAAYTATQSEAEFQRTVVDAARKLGWLDIHFPSMLANPAGFPDLILLRGGVCLFVELKRDNGRMGRRQQEWAIDLAYAGFPVRIWRPSDWDSLMETLKEGA